MRRALALLLTLWSVQASAGSLDEFWKSARSEPRWPKLPAGKESDLPAPSFTAADDVLQDDSSISPSEAARRAQQMNGGGRVLSVEPASGGWRVKLIKQGDVRIVFVPD